MAVRTYEWCQESRRNLVPAAFILDGSRGPPLSVVARLLIPPLRSEVDSGYAGSDASHPRGARAGATRVRNSYGPEATGGSEAGRLRPGTALRDCVLAG